MECKNVDKVKSLDRLFEDQSEEFVHGTERECDRDLDMMMWKLGDYENEEPPQEAAEYEEEQPIEEELIEKRIIVGSNGQPVFIEGGRSDEAVSAGKKVALAHSLAPEPIKSKVKVVGGNPPRRKKK